jgi:hypothetical protein
MRPFATLLLLASAAAPAAPDGAPARAMQDFNDGRNQRAAIGFRQAMESAAGDDRAKAEYYLAQSLDRLGLPFSAFYHFAQIVQAGPAHAYWLKAIEGAFVAAGRLRDDVVAPNLFDKAYNEQFAAVAREPLAKIHAALALFGYRAGKYEDAAQFVRRVPADSESWPAAQYVAGLLQQRTDPEEAAQTFRGMVAMPKAARELKELAALALGRTLYGLRRYAEASAAYSTLPRFSRHWDEALFEGAYADLMNGDPGSALGRLHSLHSPHLRDEFVPESLNLTAIIFHQRCLYAHVRATLAQFDREYHPMREQMKKVLAMGLAVEEHWRMLAADDPRLPAAVQHHLQKNERVASFRAYLKALDEESARIRADRALAGSALGGELTQALARQKELTEQLAGKFIQGRLAAMVRLIDVLEGDKGLIAFETTKGEKEMLETRFDVNAQLASQRIRRPAMPQTGHEYWPFDGEYWPDEIGFYRYTLKDACASGKEE